MGPLKTDDYDLKAIARQFGTPLFVFSGDAIGERVREFRAAFDANSVASMRPHIGHSNGCVVMVCHALF